VEQPVRGGGSVIGDKSGAAASVSRAWTEDYYDAVSHYAWAPDELDHLSDPNRASKGRSSPYDTVERLRRMEVPLNHILGFFFSLAPPFLVTELFKRHVGIEATGDVAYLGREFERREVVDSVTQPDFAFENDHAFLTIETKINSRSSIEQLQKYAYLHALIRERRPGRTHGLLFLTPDPDERFFGVGAKSIADARKRAAEALRAGGANKYTLQKIEMSQAPELLDSPGVLAIGHCSFGEFFGLIRHHRDASPPGTVEGRLYGGLLKELERRELARASG
jgi:hypothetical protein